MRAVILHCPHLNRDIGALRLVPEAEVLIGEPTRPAHDGCLEMHKSAIRGAMERNEPAVFVMEDDCQFTRHFNYERWLIDASWAAEHGYDLLVGASTRTYEEKLVRAGLIEVRAFHSAHCIVYFASGYEKALKAVQPYDLSLGRSVPSDYMTTYVGCRALLAFPFVAIQCPSFSGILQKNVDYVPEYERHESWLRSRFCA